MVPVLVAPPITAVGFNVIAVSGGFTVKVAALDAPEYVAVIVTGVTAVTTLVVIAKVAVVTPAATVTEAGTVTAFVLVLVSVTAAPPTGAAFARVTVPVLPAPPVTAVGFTAIEATDGFTARVIVFDAPEYVAVMITAVAEATGFVAPQTWPSWRRQQRTPTPELSQRWYCCS